MEKEKDMKKTQQKIAWSFLWDSPPEAQTSPMPRSRVAELLNAARDRGEEIKRTPKGYAIGYALRLVRMPGEVEESDPEKRHEWRFVELPPSGVYVCVDCPGRYNSGEPAPQGVCPGEAGWGPVR